MFVPCYPLSSSFFSFSIAFLFLLVHPYFTPSSSTFFFLPCPYFLLSFLFFLILTPFSFLFHQHQLLLLLFILLLLFWVILTCPFLGRAIHATHIHGEVFSEMYLRPLCSNVLKATRIGNTIDPILSATENLVTSVNVSDFSNSDHKRIAFNI